MSIAEATSPVAPSIRRFTAAELAVLPDAKRFELEDGILVERDMSVESSWIGGELAAVLRNHCKAKELGWVFPADNAYQCFPDSPDTIRKPDVSFIRFGRLTDEKLPAEGYAKIPPDLAVEVISPNDLAYEVERKIKQYLSAGVQLVWVINPDTRTIRIHRPDGTLAELGADGELSGERVVPGFRCAVRELFPPQTAPAKA